MNFMTIGNLKNKNYCQHRVYFIAFFQPTYENPRGFSIQYLFANFTLNQRNKAYTNTLAVIPKKTYENKKNISKEL